MNKHMRLAVSVLFIVIIVLAVAITRFYSGAEKNSGGGGTAPGIESRLDADSKGNRIFRDSSQLYGIVDISDRIMVSPEWESLEFMDGDMCMASKRFHGKKLYGFIDYDGNITVPFVYSSFESIKAGDHQLYLGHTADDNHIVIYNSRFAPLFSRSWDSCKVDESDIEVTSGQGKYTYSVTDSGTVFKHASIEGNVMNNTYTLDLTSRVLLSKLSVPMLEQMEQSMRLYLEYAYTGDSDVRSAIIANPSAVFLTLFPEEHSIISKKLTGISDISVYSVNTDDTIPHYAVSVTAYTALTYRNEANKTKGLRGGYKAVVEFAGTSAGDLKAVSGMFVPDKPDYPAPEPGQQTTTAPAKQDQEH